MFHPTQALQRAFNLIRIGGEGQDTVPASPS